MGKTKVKESKKPLTLSKVVVYILLILLAITIIIPVGWVFVASVKQNSEFYGSPWVLPEKIYFQNFIDAWEKASMGTYMLNSVIVTALALLLLIVISLPLIQTVHNPQFVVSQPHFTLLHPRSLNTFNKIVSAPTSAFTCLSFKTNCISIIFPPIKSTLFLS